MATTPRDSATQESRRSLLDITAEAAAADDQQPLATAPAAEDDEGRVGYGRYARFSPAALALLLIAGLAAIGLVQSRDDEPTAPVSQLVGKPAPDVTLTLLDGLPLRLADFRGSVVVLNFWASWCPYCPEEMRLLQAVADNATRTGESLAVVGVGLRTDQNDRARAMVHDLGLTYPIGRDTATDEPGIGPIERAFGLSTNVPATVFIRPDGIVDGVHLGPLTADQLRSRVGKAGDQPKA